MFVEAIFLMVISWVMLAQWVRMFVKHELRHFGRLKVFSLAEWNGLSDEERLDWSVVHFQFVKHDGVFEPLMICEKV